MADPPQEGVYAEPPVGLGVGVAGAMRFSPFDPDAESIEEAPDASLARLVVAAPPATLERRHILAHGLRALRPGGELIALARKDRGGLRLAAELAGFGCAVRSSGRRHYRICACQRPPAPIGVAAAIVAGGPQIVEALGLWSQPGVFSWNRLDAGSALLLEHLGGLAGRGADLGCGIGILARAVLAADTVSALTLADIDRRAVSAARRNIADPRASFLHADLRRETELADFDFVVMNPPFHAGGAREVGLGQGLVRAAAAALRPGGFLRMVANVALPYETELGTHFTRFAAIAREGGFKVLEAVR
ncbi:MAG: class I SAM-dependent methyltransferase [Caulobacteraceae bacterium]